MATRGYADFEEEDDPITGAIKKSIEGQGQESVDLPGMVPGAEPPAIAGPVETPVGPDGPMESAAAPPDYTKLGKFKDRMGPWNESNEKFQRPWDEMSERYKMLTVLSNFDPSAGLTPEVIEALNAANIKGAKFSGEGDKLNATGLEQWENYDGHEGVGDIIQGFKTGKGTWGGWSPLSKESAGAAAPAMGEAGLPSAMPALNSSLIPTDESFFQQLMDAAQRQTGSSMDRDALLSQMGG